MDVLPPTPDPLPNKNKFLTRIAEKYPKFFTFVKRYKIPIISVVGIIFILSIVFFITVSSKTNSEKNATSFEKTSTASESVGNDNLLITACADALDDYPEWTKENTNLVIWETPSKSFNYRASPKEPSVGIGSPVNSPGTLVDMDFVDVNEISYVSNQSNLWQIGLFKLNGMNVPDNSVIYEQKQQSSFIDISPINKKEFIVFLSDGNEGFLKYLNTNNSKEATLSKISPVNTNGLKLAVSPKGTYAYLLHDKTLTVFDINSNKQTNKIDEVKNVVWLGDSYLLYNNQKATFVYDVKTKRENQLDKSGSVLDLSFNPGDGGLIAYTQENNAQIINCTTGQILGSKENTKFRAFTSEETAIVEGENFFGFWKFKGADWTVTFIEEGSNFATTWSGY